MDRGLDFNAAERGANLAALDQVLASKTFAKSARLSSFIRYVCHAALEQRGALLTEQHIGVAVFGRPEHYNPAEDNIVRASARLLRQRLEHYYENEGSADQIHITLPRGGYLPVFVPGARMAGAAMPAPAEAAPPPSPARHPAPAKWLKAASAALATVRLRRQQRRRSGPN